MRPWIPSHLPLGLCLLLPPLVSCECAGPAPGSEGDAGVGRLLDDGGLLLADGGVVPGSGGSGGGGSGAGGGLDGGGGVTPNDGGPALEVPLEDFCAGTGAPVLVGEGNTCSGQLAENTFRFALCACENISLGGSLSVDSFDSSQGAYGGATASGAQNVGEDGQLGTNGSLVVDKKVTVAGSVFVGGAQGVMFGPGSAVTGNLYSFGPAAQETNTSVDVGRNAFINGDIGSRYQVGGTLFVPAGANVTADVDPANIVRMDIPQQLPCACDESDMLDVAALTMWAASHNDNPNLTESVDGGPGLFPSFAEDRWADPNVDGPSQIELPCGRYYLTGVNQSQGLSIRATGRVVLFVDGPLAVSGLSISVDEGAELDLFVAGDVVIGSAASFGSREQPASVRTYVGGNLSLQASSEFAGNVYAPRAEVTTSGAARVYGSLFVRSVRFGASADLHFDSAIRRASETCPEPPPPGPDPTDGGVSMRDSGVVRDDAGSTVDGGGGGTTPPPDAGGPTDPPSPGDGCSGRCDPVCGVEACLLDTNTDTLQCAPCVSDLDCCAPSLCLAGTCQVIGG